MSTPTFPYRNTFTGKIAEMTEDAASVFPEYLVRVGPDAKPFQEGLFKPGRVGEFDNPEPPTDAELAAQAVLDEVLDDHAPNSKVAREARERVKEAEAQAEAERTAAEATRKTNQEGDES